MNQWTVQQNAFVDQTVVVCPKPRRIGLRNNHTTTVYENQHHPSRSLRCYFSQQVELCESKAETDILEIILTKEDGYGYVGGGEQVNNSNKKVVIDSPSPFLCGSPPSRVSNPLIQDARFRDEIEFVASPIATKPLSSSSPSSGRKGGCVRGNFGNSPAVRIEGFDCLDRDNRNCSIPALA